jgi:hypothetical protein
MHMQRYHLPYFSELRFHEALIKDLYNPDIIPATSHQQSIWKGPRAVK